LLPNKEKDVEILEQLSSQADDRRGNFILASKCILEKIFINFKKGK